MLYGVPMKTSRLSLISSFHSVDLSFSNSSYTPCTITRLASSNTDRTPYEIITRYTQRCANKSVILLSKLHNTFAFCCINHNTIGITCDVVCVLTFILIIFIGFTR